MQQLQEKREKIESLKKLRQALQDDLGQRMGHLNNLSSALAEAYFVKNSISSLEQKKRDLSKVTDGKNDEIKMYLGYFQEQKRLQRERLDSIQIFNEKFNDECDACQKKFHTIQIRDTVSKGIKRLFLLQLCTIFFDKETQRLLYGLHKIQKINNPLNATEEEQLACALGYLGLLLYHIARVKGLILKNEFKFKGSRSYIIGQNNEQFQLFSMKPSSQQRVMNSCILIQQNLYQVMEDLNIQKQWRNQSIPIVVGKIGEMLWVDA